MLPGYISKILQCGKTFEDYPFCLLHRTTSLAYFTVVLQPMLYNVTAAYFTVVVLQST